MTQEEEKDFIEKVLRLRPICAKELNMHIDEINLDQFIKWLIDKVANNDK